MSEQIQAIKEKYDTDHEVGEDNVEIFGLDLHNPVFFASAALVFIFIFGTLLFPEKAKFIFDASKSWSIDNFDWLFMVGANLIAITCLILIFLPLGRIRIGGTKAKPEFSAISWFAMLFAAGMGIGLMFWSVAEPVIYYTATSGAPLETLPRTIEAEKMAMGATMFHWGLHAWGIYAMVGLALGFFAFNFNMPLTLRSCFYPMLGDHVWRWFGNLIDTVAVMATIFGLATSLGFGAKQAAAGLHYLFGISPGISTQVAIIFGVTLVAVFSVVRGVSRGVKILSNINMSLAALLLVFVFITGATSSIVNGIGANLVSYLENIIPLSNWIDRSDTDFYHGWTVFYWAWWISWSPFVGMFIARISKGRTVREFLLAVLIVPTLLTLVWMSTFGNSGIEQVKNNVGELVNGVNDTSLALFHMLENLPFGQITSFIAIVLVLVFFITSSDSGSLVIDSITAGGKLNVPIAQRVFWATMEGIIAAVLLFGGGDNALGALQAAAITAGLPFTIVLLFIGINLLMGLSAEYKILLHEEALERKN
ncbi:BCCT family transporter [Pleionea sediminis]|uniref:BCCT family transporter n=1 Tax=Pleionea sediminis TaxID=2569479 RepID=UPI00197B2B38|nr:BCCT family transporter [Pleionea sediminis]